MADYIAEAITEAFGDRCPEYAEGCHCCEAWRQFDRERGALELIARNYDGYGTFSGTQCSSIAEAALGQTPDDLELEEAEGDE